jgi:16S rRNA processing protein RimM
LSRSSTERILVGEIIKAHGIRGEVLVRPHTDHPDRFAPGSTLWLDEDLKTSTTVTSSRPQGSGFIVKLDGVDTRSDAEHLRGRELFIHSSQSVPPGEGEFWAHELLDFEVVDVDGGLLGTISQIHLREAQDLWEVKTEAGSVLLPAVPQFVKEIDESSRRVVVDPPDGLFE